MWNRAVKILLKLAGQILARLPISLLGRMLPPSLRFTARDVEAPPAVSGERRVIIAPLNYAGQAYEWARALERADATVSAQSAMIRKHSDFRHMADYTVPIGAYAASGRWHRTWSRHVYGNATHVIVEAQKQPLGNILAETTERQVQGLVEAGIRVAMVCHGSDIRLPSRHAASHPDSPFRNAADPVTRRLERVTQQNADLLARLGVPVFVSTPGLIADVPSATWLPVTVRPQTWATPEVPMMRRVPVVVHAPSSGWLKGTDLIDATMSRLAEEGLIEYRRIGRVPHAQMPEIVRDADIVLEQFRIGDYGVAACEAMAAGRLVMGYVSASVAQVVESATGKELPVVASRASDLEATVRRAVEDRDWARSRAFEGPSFVEEVHDGAMSAKILRDFIAQIA